MSTKISRLYSGIVVNQDARHTGSLENPGVVVQQFRLPADYRRAGSLTPPLTGFHVLATVDADTTIAYQLEQREPGVDWSVIASGEFSGPSITGDRVWVPILFDEPVDVTAMEDAFYRLRIETEAALWYVAPNPLSGDNRAYESDGTTSLLDGEGQRLSLLFRILGATAEEGTDFLGNRFRSAVRKRSIDLAQTAANPDATWMSGPMPSKFAVVSLYFDVSDSSGNPVVVDRCILDPTTPEVWVHAYYSDDGEPGRTDAEWEDRIWTRVERSHHLRRKGAFVFPEPVRAKYIKLEFSHLQAKPYQPGEFERPVRYKKHPKWVLDYFLLATEEARESIENNFIAKSIEVNYDAYDLAYRYFRDDLGLGVDSAPVLTPDELRRLQQFVAQRGDDPSDAVDYETAGRISTAMHPFRQNSRFRGNSDGLLGSILATQPLHVRPEPTERPPSQVTWTEPVSNLNREGLVFEQHFPVMFFFVPCRHFYREVEASFHSGVAYFVGLKEVSFTREQFGVGSDVQSYAETLGDFVNVERNDFIGLSSPPIPEPK